MWLLTRRGALSCAVFTGVFTIVELILVAVFVRRGGYWWAAVHGVCAAIQGRGWLFWFARWSVARATYEGWSGATVVVLGEDGVTELPIDVDRWERARAVEVALTERGPELHYGRPPWYPPPRRSLVHRALHR